MLLKKVYPVLGFLLFVHLLILVSSVNHFGPVYALSVSVFTDIVAVGTIVTTVVVFVFVLLVIINMMHRS